MNFEDLHELLRLELLRRIEGGALTGTALARQAGFRQGHVSNFLNRKRSLSLQGLDRVMAAQGLSVDQILPLEMSASGSGGDIASVGAAGQEPGDGLESVPVVSASTAMESATVREELVIERVAVAVGRLAASRVQPPAKVAHWQRFVAVRADAQQAAAMAPAIPPGAVVVLDRHYRSLAPFRALERNIYAVAAGGGVVLRYVEFDAGRLILRPLAQEAPVQLLALGAQQSPEDFIVGRVCVVVSEL